MIYVIIVLSITICVLLVLWNGAVNTHKRYREHMRSSEDKRVDHLKEMLYATMEKHRMEKIAWEKDARRSKKDALQKQRGCVKGKIAEAMVPFMDEFGFEPADARFIGSPIDYVVFNGHSNGKITDVVFVEVKSGSGKLSSMQKQVREAVESDYVGWKEVRIAQQGQDEEEIS